MNEGDAIFHERQSMEMCCMHALNNLFQGVAFTKQTMDTICRELSPDAHWLFNPHRSMFGLGNYDVNVLMSALHTKDCTAVWFDRRKSVLHSKFENKDVRCVDFDQVVGFVVNVPSEARLGPLPIPFLSNRRHWFAVREIAGAYYNLDSKLNEPLIIGDRQAAAEFLAESLRNSDKLQLFIVISRDVEAADNLLFRSDNPPAQNSS